jgi:hypothetical protein
MTEYGPVTIREATRLVNTPNGNARYRLLMSNGEVIFTRGDSAVIDQLKNILGNGPFADNTSSNVQFTYTLDPIGKLASVTRV